MPNPDIKDPLVPQQGNSVFDSIPERPWREKLKFKQPASMTEPVVAERCVACIANSTEVAIDIKHTYENGCELAMAEPVATLPACLCGLDTNPVASPRMDVHCPKHDAPGGEPELLPDQVVAMIKESVDCEYNDLVGYKARLGAALVDLKLLLDTRVSSAPELDIANSTVALDGNRYPLPAPQVEGAAVSQPAGEPSDCSNPKCPCDDWVATAQPSSTPSDVAQAAADEIAERWFNDDLPFEASLQSLKLEQLRALATKVINKHFTATKRQEGEGDE